MPVFVEDPAHFSKSRLKSDLIAHNVSLPPAGSRKEVYVELYLKHVDQKNAADFSSDEEDQVQDVAEKEEDPVDPEMLDPRRLTDDELNATLLKHGVKAGPIVASTRAVYEKKLKQLLQADVQPRLNGTGDTALYSDSEEDEDNEEEEEEEESVSEQARQETVSQLEQTKQDNSQVPSGSRSVKCNGSTSSSSQAFSITQMVEEMVSRSSLSPSADRERGWNESSLHEHWSQSHGLDMPKVDKYTMTNRSLYHTPNASPNKPDIKLPQEPVTDVLMEMFPDTVPTPTGICATRRRPIKGAAGRPVQYKYPDTPVSPTTLERREVERRLVPVRIQILVFLIVACLLYLIYACMEDNTFNPFSGLLDNLSQETDSEEGLLLQTETQDAPMQDPLYGHD
ncbi:LEM domain-containing protein 1 [Polymixia lowei]